MTDVTEIWEDLVWPRGGRIVYLALHGVGGIPEPERGRTELQAAHTHNLDQLATE